MYFLCISFTMFLSLFTSYLLSSFLSPPNGNLITFPLTSAAQSTADSIWKLELFSGSVGVVNKTVGSL